MKNWLLLSFFIGLLAYTVYQSPQFHESQETGTTLRAMDSTSQKVRNEQGAGEQTNLNGKEDQVQATETEVVQSTQSPAVGSAAPPFHLKGLDGNSYSLNGKRDKPLILNFWASWCGPCRAEAPAFREFYLKNRHRVDIYGINVTVNDDLDSAAEFVSSFGLPFPIPMDVEGKAAQAYRIQAFPTTYFIDRNGIIRHVHIGILDAKSLRVYTDSMLQID